MSEAYKETKTDVDTSLAANLESTEAKRTEQLETVKTGVDKAIEEYDALFESSKYNIENGTKLTNIAKNITTGLATFADSTDIKKNLDSLQAEYDKKDAIATRLEATGNTEAAKAAREAEQNAKGKLGKAYFATLKEGDKISWTMADGTVVEGTVGKQKDGAKTLHVILDEIPEGSKKADRYIGFDKLIA